MIAARRLVSIFLAVATTTAFSLSQVPDLVTAFDAGGRAMGAGGSFYATGGDTVAASVNPAALGYIDTRRIGMALRNFPTSNTAVSGSLSDLLLNTSSDEGAMMFSHFGFAMPLRKNSGTLGLTWTVSGWMDDRQFGTGLTGGIATYEDSVKLKTDLLTLAFGQASRDRGFSWGAGVVYALQYLKNFQRTTFTDPNIPPQVVDTEDAGGGIGGVIGIMYTPADRPDFTFGASLRTPIDINNGGPALDLYHRIPGRLSTGISIYRDGFRRGRDSLLYAIQADYFFGGEDSQRVDRNNHAALGAGIEYGYSMGGSVIPFRLGYRWVPAGGDDFAQRNGITYGIGYRPGIGDWMLDLNFGVFEGIRDTNLSFSYRFKK